VVKTPVTRAVSHIVLGAVTADTVFHVAFRKPTPPAPKPKKAKTKAEVVEEIEQEGSVEQHWSDDGTPAPKCTITAHFIEYINEVLDIMDEAGDIKGYYRVMDNCNIHKNKYNLMQPEVFLNESYCHVDHHAEKSWGKKVSKKIRGRQQMIVMFGAFVVYRVGRSIDAKMIKTSTKVWSILKKKDNDAENDYCGNSDADKFEKLFEDLCVALERYGLYIIS
jgi:hypothetical protein